MQHKDTKQIHAHTLVAETAKALTHELYDTIMTKMPVMYAQWKKGREGWTAKQLEEGFVQKYYANALGSARAMLAAQLNGPCDEGLKETIMEALILDNSLKRGRGK